jgi:pimeloyl-ACP methyl ester carboxylesterase
MIVERVEFHNNLNQRLIGRLYKKGSGTNSGVVFSHGLFSNKDGYKITRLAGDIVSTGKQLLTFDFSFSGESGGSIKQLSMLQEVGDLASAVDYMKGLGMQKIHLMGSSMGAAVTLVYASENRNGIASLILIATPVDLKGIFLSDTGLTDVDSIPENGYAIIDGKPVRKEFFREVNSIDMPGALNKISVPVLAIHGGRDETVDPGNVELLGKYLGKGLKKIIIPDGDHSLTRDSDLEILRSEIVAWLKAQ